MASPRATGHSVGVGVYGDQTIEEPGLTVPHPRLAERDFVLEPLHELDPELALPDGRRIIELWNG